MFKKPAEEKNTEKVAWKKPAIGDVEKLIIKHLEGFARKGARIKSGGFIPFGHFNLDFAISQGTLPIKVDLAALEGFDPKNPGGIPRGKLVEIYGETGGGKSSLCHRAVGNAQKLKLASMWVDREQSYVESLAELNGVDLDNLYMMNDPTVPAEVCFDHIYKSLDDGIDLVIVDSVSGLIPKAVLEGTDSTKDTMALLARVMGKCIPKLSSLCAKTGGTVVFINQIRQKPGVMFGDPLVTPGGETLKFFSSLRLQVTKRYGADAESYREDENGIDQLIAQDSYVYTRKNRFAKSLKNGIPVPIYFEPYFPSAEEVAFDFGRQTKVVTVRNDIFSWTQPDKTKIVAPAVGRKSFIDEIVKGKLLDTLIADIKRVADETGVVLPPELMTFKVVSAKEITKKEAKKGKKTEEIEEFLEEEANSPQEASEVGIKNEDDVSRSRKKKNSKLGPENALD